MANNPEDDRHIELDQLESELREAIERSPDNVQYYLKLAEVLWDKGELSKALELLSDVRGRFMGEGKKRAEDQIRRISDAEAIWENIVSAVVSPRRSRVASEKYCGHERSLESLENKLWEYANGLMSEDEEDKFLGQIKECKYCLAKLVSTQKKLEEVQEESVWPYEKVKAAIEKDLGMRKVESLMQEFAGLIKKVPAHLQNSLESIGHNLNDLFRKTFIYPTPCFSPVFGKSPVTVLSPFGKVRYPILFEWSLFKGAKQYSISIDEVNLSITTAKNKVKITKEDLVLESGKEYMWELKIFRGKNKIEEIACFFSLGTEKEIKELEAIEKEANKIDAEEDMLMLFAAILEEKGFLIEAVEKYKQAYKINSSENIAYRIASCYDKLELEALRDEWNRKILEKEHTLE